MDKHPQDNFFQLAIVRSSGQKLRPLPVGPRWWGPPSPRRLAMPGEELINHPALQNTLQAKLILRMPAAMPALRRYALRVAVRRISRWLLRYVAGGTPSGVHAPAAVLAFRRPKRILLPPALADGHAGRKMPSGSVGHGIDHEAASKEGGRR